MRKLFILGTAIVVSVAMLMTSCKKEEVNNNGNNSNTENPGGGGSGGGSGSGGGTGSANTDYPSTAIVIHNAVTDIDGNRYDAVQIGNQVWMAENLRTTKYSDGTVIPISSSTSSTIAYRYVPKNDMNYVPSYGYLYNWTAVMHGENISDDDPIGVQGICPTGWHVPNGSEWSQMKEYMKSQSLYWSNGSPNHIAKALSATWGWDSVEEEYNVYAPGCNMSTNNATGFSALPAGIANGGGFGSSAQFWTSSKDGSHPAYSIHWGNVYNPEFDLYYGETEEYRSLSVRCVRD